MKPIKYLFVLFTFVALVSCSEENDNPSEEQSIIVGEWNLEEVNYSGTSTASQGGYTTSASYIGEYYDIDSRLILNSDNTYRTEGSYMVELTTIVAGQTSIQNLPFSDVEVTGTYRIDNDKLILGSNNESQQPQQPGNLNMAAITEGTIVELTANRLVVAFDQDISSEMEGAEVNISIEGLQVYSR